MSYPDLPANRIIVNGTDLTAEFGLILIDGYVLAPPKVKTYVVDIPGGNGSLDLTESLLGDTAFGNRKQEFTFYVINPADFESVKRQVSNFLHGRSYDYQLTMDPGYTYTGRFSISSYEHYSHADGKVGMIKMEIDAKPFKRGADRLYSLNPIGGVTYLFESGRRRVCPIIQTDTFVKVIYDHKLTMLQQGTWSINDILFTYGVNELYINSYDIRNVTWGQLKAGTTWGDLKQQRLYELYRGNGDGTYSIATWSEFENTTWEELADQTWGEILYIHELVDANSNVIISYEVGEL